MTPNPIQGVKSMTQPKPKWAAYLRVSTQEQRTDSQRQVIRDYLKREGIPQGQVKWFTDKKTGTTLERSELAKMLRAVDQGKVSTVVCYSLDRMARSLAHGVGLLQQLCERNVRVVSVTQQLDFSGIIGQTIAAVLFGLGQAEVEHRRAGNPSRAQGCCRGERGHPWASPQSEAVELHQADALAGDDRQPDCRQTRLQQNQRLQRPEENAERRGRSGVSEDRRRCKAAAVSFVLTAACRSAEIPIGGLTDALDNPLRTL